MDTDWLEAFVHAVEGGSLSAAARTLQTDLSTTSRRVRALEEFVGHPLLERTARGTRPTPEGSRLASRARDLLRELDTALREAAEPGTPTSVVLTCPPEVAASLLPRVVPAVIEEHPTARIEIAPSARRVGLIEEGYDAAFRIGDHGSERLLLRDLGPLRLVTCARPGIGPTGHVRVRSVPTRLDEGLSGPAFVTVSTFGQAAALVLHSTWEATVPLYCIRGPLARGELVVRRRLMAPEVHLYLALVPERRTDPVLTTLADLARDELLRIQTEAGGGMTTSMPTVTTQS